jgi:hypothetical protein
MAILSAVDDGDVMDSNHFLKPGIDLLKGGRLK